MALFVKTKFSNRECRANPNVCVCLCAYIYLHIHTITQMHTLTCACVLSLSCIQPFETMDCSPPGSSVHGVLQSGVLEWVAIYHQITRVKDCKSQIKFSEPKTTFCLNLYSWKVFLYCVILITISVFTHDVLLTSNEYFFRYYLSYLANCCCYTVGFQKEETK